MDCVNPGPVDTGYVTPDTVEQMSPMFPLGRWGEPDAPGENLCRPFSGSAVSYALQNAKSP